MTAEVPVEAQIDDILKEFFPETQGTVQPKSDHENVAFPVPPGYIRVPLITSLLEVC